ncbi:MAG TPA: phosphomethylpyrimidine synthase ThiC [bacterium]|nr:phosphomethylpyrimidine synthase ThiC [bacterium]HOL35351.1 phosphomethylpyrimidine synthase ThiC [bacterium]HPP07717.1 phosphomethylpyrimidine synthase ThiC [bacterium]
MILEKHQAKKGIITDAVKSVASIEQVDPEKLAISIAEGKAIILKHKNMFVGIGENLTVKVNTNIGTSPDVCDINFELEKLKTACRLKSDTVMDLSTGGDLDSIRQTIVNASSIPVGSVPIYQAMIQTIEKYGTIEKLKEDEIFKVIEKHARDGISFVTVHCGVTLSSLELLRKKSRKTGIVSRGGAFIASWMISTGKENPLYANFDRLIEIARKYDLVLSLGDGLRPGCLADASDSLQMAELLTLGDLTQRAWEADVQVIIEGPGHIPLHQVVPNVHLAKTICHGAPLYLLGPLVTDVAAGYDHITSAIGGAIAAWAGADFLCYVTPSEHLALPTINDVEDGVVASKIAAHAADIARSHPKARTWDDEISVARYKRDWKRQEQLVINPERFKKIRQSQKVYSEDVCNMCGKYCAMKIMDDIIKKSGL